MQNVKSLNNKLQRQKRTRSKLSGTADCPRLSIFRSNKYIYAQLIDDKKGLVLASASSLKLSVKNNLEAAGQVGESIAKQALENKINKVIFDRGSYRYHGQVKAVAEGARSAGLNF